VLELTSQGYSQREIASKLQMDLAAVNRDIQFLRHQAQENLQKHIHETVPEEYQKGMVGLRQNLKHVLEIAETSSDPRVKLEARRIANDCYRYIMDLTTNGIIVTDAIKYVQGKMDHLNTEEKKLLQDIKGKEDAESEDNRRSENSERDLEEQQQTHNGIF
ncbi:MAG: hypothetical protein WB815_08140, partial [Nitrososphaeraceae archaeon]